MTLQGAKQNRSRKGKRITAFTVFNYGFFTLVAVIMLFPLWNVLVISFSNYAEYVANPLMLFPKNISFDAYKYIFSTNELLEAMEVTVTVTLVGTVYSMLITTTAAYALSKKTLPGRSVFLTMVLFTMLFNGGLVPTFLLIKQLGLYDTIAALILPNALNTWYLIIMKNAFSGIPEAMEESARIDGANDVQILLRIVLPVSMPIIATFVLFYGVDRWNEWWSAMLYINNTHKYPLQLMLRNLIVMNFSSAAMATSYAQESANFVAKENIKMATAIVAIVPITVLYPFLQKYFTKGVLVGAIKS